MVLHTRAIGRTTTPDKNDTVLLDIMTYYIPTSLASYFTPTNSRQNNGENPTFTRNIRRHHLPTAQPDSRRLPLAGIGLLRLRDTRLETHALHLGSADQRGGPRAARALRLAAAAPHLVVGCLAEGGGGEMAGERAPGAEAGCCDGGGCAEDGLEAAGGGLGEGRDGGERGPLHEGAQGAESE